MSRNVGTFNFAANFEGLFEAPVDAKQLVGTYADLTAPTSWCGSGSVWLYDGAIVAVGSDPTPGNNGVYWLCDANNYTATGSWIKLGGGGGNTVDVCNQSVCGIYSATTTNEFIGAITGSTIFLPNVPNLGQKISISDIVGTASLCNITVCSDTYNIVGEQYSIISTDYGSTSFIFNGIFWSTVAFIN